jgi:hypothetical protein
MKRSAWLITAVVATFISAAPALAQGPGGNGSLKFRAGGFFPAAGGDFWDAQKDLFGVEKSDYNDAMVGMSWVAPMGNFVELGFNIDLYEVTDRSADLGFTDDAGFSILHDTTLRLVPMTVDVRVLPAGRYAQRGRLSARRPVPFIGAGLGLNYWQYEERGDFVFFDTLGDPFIEFDRFRDSGTAFETHVLAGIEIPMSRMWNLTFEGRYSWSKTETESYLASEGYTSDKLDLGGAAVFVGASLQF